jgi:hypothetical protein
MTRANIIELVQATMDEVHPFDQGETITDVQIDKQLELSAVLLMEMLPSVLANPTSATVGTLTVSNHTSGVSLDIKCPADFIRIHRIKLLDWVRPVIELMPDGIRLLYEQDYDYLRATIRRPKAALYRKDTFDYITCYPAPVIPETDPPASYISEFVYVQKPTAAETLPDDLIEMLAWKCASKIYSISRQADLAQVCDARLSEIVQSKLKYRG